MQIFDLPTNQINFIHNYAFPIHNVKLFFLWETVIKKHYIFVQCYVKWTCPKKTIIKKMQEAATLSHEFNVMHNLFYKIIVVIIDDG